MTSILGSYTIIKKTINFEKLIIIKNFIDQEIILQEWTNKINANYYDAWSKSNLFLKIFNDLETKSVLKSIFDYVKSCYYVDINLKDKKYYKKFQDKIELHKENIIIREFIIDYDIKITQTELDNLQALIPEIDINGCENFLVIKKLQNFMLTNFRWEFNYDICLNYINKKFSNISLDANIQGFGNWEKLEKWLTIHNINFLGKKFNQTSGFYLWKKYLTTFLNSKNYIQCCQKWNINKKQLNKNLQNTDLNILKLFIISSFEELKYDTFFAQYQKIFINSVQEIITKCPEYPIKKMCKVIMWIIFENYIFYDFLNEFYLYVKNKFDAKNNIFLEK